MVFTKAWFALMKRNLLYRKRYWLSSIFEFILPWVFLLLLIWLRSALGDSIKPFEVDAEIPQAFQVRTPLRFHDYLTALQAKRICVAKHASSLADFFTDCLPNGLGDVTLDPELLQGYTVDDLPFVLRQANATEDEIEMFNQVIPSVMRSCAMQGKFNARASFTISGMGQVSHVPMIKCNPHLCTENYEDAEPFCERQIVGLSGNKDRVRAFIAWVEKEYPAEKDLKVFYTFETTDSMDMYVQNSLYGKNDEHGRYPKLAMGIVFEEDENPSVWKYQLRPNSTNYNDAPTPGDRPRAAARTTPETSRVTDAYARSEEEACGLQSFAVDFEAQISCMIQYADNGVLTYQRLVHDFILDQTGAKESVGSMSFVTFPTPAFSVAEFLKTLSTFLTLFVIIGLLYPVASMVSYIVKEKEFRQKELMKAMSVTEADIELSWLVSFVVFHLFTATVASAMSQYVFLDTSLLLLWVFWVLTMISSIMLSTAIAAITAKATRAVLFAVLGFFAGYLITLALDFETGERILIQLVSLHPVTAFSYGVSQITSLESIGVGLSFENIGFSDTPSGYSFVDTLTMLVVDIVVWGVVTWYLNRAIQPDYGQALPFYFPLQLSYWFPPRHVSASLKVNPDEKNAGIPFEKVDAALDKQREAQKTIELHNLRKVFGDKHAVDGLSLTMYSGHITALLGHNGAGKTTTISMLMGAVKPTDGYATILGKDVRKDLDLIRKNIGVCLQHDCLFPDLTVREHVQFFAQLKGFYANKSVAEANELLDQSIRDVALFEKRNTRSKALSGGMKRKLSLCMAFCGGSEVVLLDEPTSGMDPFSRRFTWDVIRQYRKDRCIILTTHFMDEADILGDRIAIMAGGQLRCAGSPLFLKKAYGVGYQLTVEKTTSGSVEDSTADETEPFNDGSSELVELVKSYVPESSVLSNVGTELKLQLPVGAAHKFPSLLRKLDKKVDSNKAVSYGVSMTTMDEVFLLVARGDHGGSSRPIKSSRRKQSKEELSLEKHSKIPISDRALFTRHVNALVKKRAANFKRDKKAWCCTTLLPSLFVLVGFLVYSRRTGGRSLPALTLDIGELNSNVGGDMANPIPVNAQSSYTCLPGSCLVDEEFGYVATGEVYSYCLGVEQEYSSCPVSSAPVNILGEMEKIEGVSLVQTESVETVAESSAFLLGTANAYEASKYGAIWITKDGSSSLSYTNGTLDDWSVAECYENVDRGFQYLTYRDCERLRGIGVLIQYNFTALHSAPLFQAMVDQALARSSSDDPNVEIKATIAPLPLTHVEQEFGGAEDSFFVWILIILSFPFISGAYASFIVMERESKAKHLQTVAGVQPLAYWISSFVWDVLNYQLPLWIIVAMMFVFDFGLLTSSENDMFAGVLALLFLYGPAAAGFAYCASFAFKSATLCNVVLIISSFVLSLGGSLSVYFMTIFVESGDAGENVRITRNVFLWILRLFPACNLAKGLLFALNSAQLSLLAEKPEQSVFSEDILLAEIIILGCQGIVYTGLAVLLDLWTTNPKSMGCLGKLFDILFCRCRNGSRAPPISLPDDSDVVAEENRVLSGGADNDLIKMSELSKVYPNGKVAVQRLSLGIAPGECFGLLGINGAGKTTTMGMLTAEFAPTGGDASLSGFSIVSEPQKIRRRIGYCPQFDAHFANMTGREHVALYASVKGIHANLVDYAVSRKLHEVGLRSYDSDRLCSNYSGGMKRRLSIACATIGQPRIVFLDECSTGVDPVARREIWQLVSDMVNSNNTPKEERTSVILTTHSMEECEALCPRIGIMANGGLRCLGSAQHLKNKFGQGYQLEINGKETENGDADFIANTGILAQAKGVKVDSESGIPAENPPLSLDEVASCLQALTKSATLSNMVSPDNPQGHKIWTAATSPSGVSLYDLSVFATNELRMKKINDFVIENFPNHVIRERQDSKIRYELSSEGMRISIIFALVEENKDALRIVDYGVSQTSLEQVFNRHAAEAEALKQGRDDR